LKPDRAVSPKLTARWSNRTSFVFLPLIPSVFCLNGACWKPVCLLSGFIYETSFVKWGRICICGMQSVVKMSCSLKYVVFIYMRVHAVNM
jgi:hypothetical protein